MTFVWPELLWLLALVPVAAVAYAVAMRRKRKAALRYASLALVRDAAGAAGTLRRRLPPSLFLLALALMIFAVARPTAVVTLPSAHETVILAMDVSGSMKATDVKPTRLAAAQEAARAFVADQPRTTRIGVVSFAATASIVQAPTHNREDILGAIERFQLQRGTAIGSGILMSLKTIFPDAEFDLRSWNPRREAAKGAAREPAKDPSDTAGRDGAKAVAPGSLKSAAIVLLTDGQTTAGPNPLEAARMAADRGVRVYTVGIGTSAGQIVGAEGWSMRVRLDEEALKSIANATQGEYFHAGDAADLAKIYRTLHSKLFFERRETEITAIFAAAAAALALLSATLSLLWFNRIL